MWLTVIGVTMTNKSVAGKRAGAPEKRRKRWRRRSVSRRRQRQRRLPYACKWRAGGAAASQPGSAFAAQRHTAPPCRASAGGIWHGGRWRWRLAAAALAPASRWRKTAAARAQRKSWRREESWKTHLQLAAAALALRALWRQPPAAL